MRRRWSSRFALAVLALPAPAAADKATTSVIASGDVSATDNVFASTRETRESDVAFTLRPGVLFGYDGPRVSHELVGEGEVIEFARHSEKPSVAVRGSYRTRIVTSRYTSLSAGLDGANGVSTGLSARSSPDTTGPALVPLGRVDTVTASGNVALSWDSGRNLQITPSAFARYSRADDNADDMGAEAATITTSEEAGGQLAIERGWRDNALSFEGGASILRLDRDAPLSAMQGPRLDRQINPRVRIAWRHDFDRKWSGQLDAGAVYVHPYKKDPNNPGVPLEDGIFPVAGAGVSYTEVWGRAGLAVRRDVAPNLLVAQNTVNESAGVQLAMPLPWLDDNSHRRQPRLVGLGSLGVARTQLIDSQTSDTVNTFYVGSLDVGLGYSPRPGFTYGLRYQFQYQTGQGNAELVVPGFWRNTLSFTFQLRYPEQANGEEARRKNKGTRADGKDLVPIGVDPVSTDLGGGVDGGGGGE